MMKKYRGKGRRNFDPPADGRYITIVCNIMASGRTFCEQAAAAIKARNRGRGRGKAADSLSCEMR